MKTAFETHTLATLAERFRGLISRNTISAWLETQKLKPEMAKQERGRIRYLFRTQNLDGLLAYLEKEHDTRVQRLTASEKAFKEIRLNARREALGIIRHNQTDEVQSGRTPPQVEPNPALNDSDAIGTGCQFSAFTKWEKE